MDKPNVFRTSNFYMNKWDKLIVRIKTVSGDSVQLDLVSGDTGTTGDSSALRVTDKDGNIYRTTIIGNQEWITSNLITTSYADGSSIANITNGSTWAADTTGAYCWYNNDIGNKSLYGALYNWHAVDNVAGLAYMERDGSPEAGWRVPTDADIATLLAFVGDNSAVKLKDDRDLWVNPDGTEYLNEYKFTIVPAGYRLGAYIVDGQFQLLGVTGIFWGADDDGGNASAYYTGYGTGANPDVVVSALDKGRGFSVRLVRDI